MYSFYFQTHTPSKKVAKCSISPDRYIALVSIHSSYPAKLARNTKVSSNKVQFWCDANMTWVNSSKAGIDFTE